MHRHIEWDDPGSASVSKLFANDHHGHARIGTGDILSARYQGKIVRVEVEAYREEDAVSIGKVVAILDAKGNRLKGMDKLDIGDIVRLPDDKRAFEKREDND
ncbi:hypothetical protein [Vreelandella nanhaiensis]|uniref:Uncharacterized protein n=1 Tax=Vreelandella nanhaiensis TaxID=1258546 RepID=A0A3S0W5V0_9GAMM|nr:hypothetical protein [Halomonas nanhaiensis]RUR29067.1 hypothetical protein ELY38_15955 [Halomonas nanhaiensis]